MIITISGMPGAGKSSVAKIVSEKLKLERIYVGGIRRELAREKDMTLEELNEYALTHSETDIDVDKEAAKRAKEMDNVIVEGRTQFHFLPESIKIYLRVNLSEGARRIWEQIKDNKEKEERNENEVNSLEEMEENLKKRMENDTERYMKYYGFDCYDEKHYDLIIDTTSITVEGVAEKIVEFAERFK